MMVLNYHGKALKKLYKYIIILPQNNLCSPDLKNLIKKKNKDLMLKVKHLKEIKV